MKKGVHMAKSILGVEIGTRRIKLVQVSGTEAEKFLTVQVPEDNVKSDTIIAWDAMAETLKGALKDGGFTAKKAALVVPDSAAYVRRMIMPAMTESQLMVNLPYEFRDFIQDDKDKYSFDYAMIEMKYTGENADAPTDMELIGAAMPKALLEQYTELFNHAGLRLIKAVPRIIALQNLIRSLSEENLKTDMAILDLGYGVTKVDIFRNGIYEVTRSIDIGLKDVALAISNKLNCDPHIASSYLNSNQNDVLESQECREVYAQIAVEIMRAVNYYTYENQGSSLDKLYYNGFGSWIKPLIQEISDSVQLTLVPLSDFKATEKEALLNNAAAIGACLD